jgi:hypothetical protein
MLRPIWTLEAFPVLAGAGDGKQPSGATNKKANNRKVTLNPLPELFPDEAFHAQFQQTRFRENNSTPLFPNVFSGRIIVVLN